MSRPSPNNVRRWLTPTAATGLDAVLGGDTHDPLDARPARTGPHSARRTSNTHSVVTTQRLLVWSRSLRYVRKQPHGRKTAPPGRTLVHAPSLK